MLSNLKCRINHQEYECVCCKNYKMKYNLKFKLNYYIIGLQQFTDQNYILLSIVVIEYGDLKLFHFISFFCVKKEAFLLLLKLLIFYIFINK